MKSELLLEPLLIGRTQELKELKASLSAAFEGKGTTLFLSGEAGSGKTRLASEFLAFARNQGAIVLSGWCLNNAAVPYFPFVEAFDSYPLTNEEQNKSIGNQQMSAKTWLLGQEGVQTVSPQAWKDKTFATVTKELLQISTINPLILFIDDLQWADSASLSLLHYISRSIVSERIMILGTFRSEEVNVNSEGFGHQLIETLRLMGREALFNEIHISGLSKADVEGIAESMLSGKVQESLIANLAAESHGIPLFVVESLRMLYEQGGLVEAEGQWRLCFEKYNIPAKVKDVILRRVEALKPSQRRILEAAAVIGEKFDPKLVAAVLSQDNLDVLESLNAIAECTLLVYCEDNYYRFDHIKSQELLSERIPLLLKKEYHSRIAEKLESFGQSLLEFPVGDLAYHYSQAGNKEKSIKYSLAAGKDALARFSNLEAIKYFTYVNQNISEIDKNFNDKITALEGLGDGFQANMMFKEAAKTFEDLANLGGISRLRALRKAMEASFFQDDIPLLKELIKRADSFGSIDRLESARILHNKGRVLVLQGEQVLAVENFEKANKVFEEEYSLWDTAWDLIALGVNLPTIGQLEKALAASLRAIALFEELGDYRWLVEAYNMAGLTCVAYFGFWEEGMSFFEKADKINQDQNIGDYLRLAQLNGEWAWMHMAMGDVKEAVSKSLKALSYSEKTDSNWAKGLAYSNLAMYYTIIEEITLAELYFGKLMQLPKEVLLNPILNTPMTTAVFLAGKNQWEESTKVFKTMFDHFKKNPTSGVEAIVKRSYAWALGRQGFHSEAKKQIDEVQEFYRGVNQRFEHVNVQASLMAPAKVLCDQEFDVRLDLVNISRGRGLIIRVDRIVIPEYEIVTLSKEAIVQNDSIELLDNKLEPFSVISVKFRLRATKTGVFKLSSQVAYVSDLGKNKVSKSNIVEINVMPDPSCIGLEKAVQEKQDKIEFKSEASGKVFDYLVKAFKEDYKGQRFALERSGWRTLMDVVRAAGTSKYSVYGSLGGRGNAIVDLERMGLIETRVFTGERGRGGKVFKVRIAYENESVRYQTDQINS